MWTYTGVSHKPHTVAENEWMLLQRRKHNLSIGSPQCKKRASVFLHKSTGGASELGPLGKLAGFWSQALIGSVMAARNPPESGTRPGPFRRDTRPTDWLPEIYETKVTVTESRLSFFLFCGGFSPARRFHLASSSDAEGTIQFQRHVHDEDGTSASSCSRVLFLPRAPRNERLGKQRRPVDFLRRQEKHHICANNLISRRISQPSDTTGQRTATRPGCRRADDTDRTLARPSTLKPPDDGLFLDGGSHASHGPVMVYQPPIRDIWSSLLVFFPRARLPTRTTPSLRRRTTHH